MYEEAPGFRPGPRVMTRAQARGDRVVLSITDFTLAASCPRQPVLFGRPYPLGAHWSCGLGFQVVHAASQQHTKATWSRVCRHELHIGILEHDLSAGPSSNFRLDLSPF